MIFLVEKSISFSDLPSTIISEIRSRIEVRESLVILVCYMR